jgi:hypothetical protein
MQILPLRAAARAALYLLLAALASACGGGTDGNAGGGGSTDGSNPPPAPTLSITQRQVEVSGQTGGPAPTSVTIPFTVANAPAGTLYTNVTLSGDSVAAASASWQSSGSGSLTITFGSPDQLGAGNYSETISLSVCTDSACAHPITGAPATVTVTYAVTGSALPPVSFYLPTPLTNFQASTNVTTPETTNFTFYIKNVPPAGLYAALSQPTGGFIAHVTDTVEPDSLGELVVTLDFTLVSPASLGSGYFSSSVTVAICYDQACSKPVAGSPVTVPIYYEVFLTQGKEYTQVSSSLGGLSDLAYDSASHQLYVTSLAGYSAGTSGAVIQIDPTTGQVAVQTPVNDGLATIALSDDGQLLYAGSKENPLVYRLTLPSLQSDITIPLGSASTPNGSDPNIVAQMAVAPAAPRTLAIALAHPTGPNFSQGIAVFDDAVERPQVLDPLGYYASADFIAWGATASTLYAFRNSYQEPNDWEIDTLQVNSSGLTIQNAFNLTGSADSGGHISFDGGELYESSGFVRDASTGAVLGQVALPDNSSVSPNSGGILCVTPDSAHARLFVLVHDGQSSHLLLFVYQLPSLALQGAIDLGYDSFDVAVTTRMILWGTQGLAFNRNGLQILSGSFYAPGSGTSTGSTSSAMTRHTTRSPLRTILIARPGS